MWLAILLFCILSATESHQIRHFLLNLNFSYGLHSTHLRLRFNEESFRISRPIGIYLDSYPLEWKGQLEGYQGETREIILRPGRTKASISLTFMGEDISLQYFLSCEPNFYGSWCSKRCIPDENGGHFTCNSNGERDCRPGWTGEFCSEELLMCSPSPCKNRANCLEMGNGQFECQCLSAYEGIFCERIKQVITPPPPPSPPTSRSSTSSPITQSSAKYIQPQPTTTPPRPPESSKEISNFSYVLHIISILLCITLVISVIGVGAVFLFRKWNRKMIPPKINVETSPRYVAPPKSRICFETAPELPKSEKPKHYVSAEDLHV